MRFSAAGSKRLAELALAVIMGAGLAACGGSTGSASSASSPSSVGSVSSASTGNGLTSSVAAAGSTSTPTSKSVTLSWNAPTQNSNGTSLTNLAGYTLHYGTSSEDYTGSIEITSPTQTSYLVSDSSFPPGTYYFAISAYNAQQVSSSLSSEITVNVD